MREFRWPLRLGMAALLVLVATTVASTSLGAGGPSASTLPGACPGAASALRGLGAAPPRSIADLTREPWFRVDHELSGDGELVARRLTLGWFGEVGRRSIRLAPESFVSGPFGRHVLFGSDDGTRSRLAAFDGERDCVVELGTSSDVVRRATIDPGGTMLYEHRVDRPTRADLGVVRRPIAGGASTRVVDGIDPVAPWGITFSTELAWSLDGSRLAVQACGALLCRTRVVDPATGRVALLAGPGQGSLIGLTGDELVSHAACPGMPCPVLATPLDGGPTRVVVDAAGLATLTDTGAQPVLVHELGEGLLGLVGLTDGSRRMQAVDRGLGVLPDPARAGRGFRTPRGTIGLAPAGDPVPDEPGWLLDVRAAVVRALPEVTR